MNLLFDLDGTLTDPRQGILACFRHALDSLGVNVPSDQQLHALIGPPLRESFSALLPDAALVENAVALYRERFAAKGMFENKVYPGIEGALDDLRRSGARLFVATAKPRVFAGEILQFFKLRRFFDAVYGSELDGSLDDKADLLAHLLPAEKLSRSETIMIGDRVHDIVAARANGIVSIGALWGFGGRAELAGAGADMLCAAPGELVASIAKMKS